jgi:hypothetical protein
MAKNRVSVKDKNGNIFSVSVTDPRYLSKELVGIEKDMISAKDRDGNKIKVHKTDPRYLSGELVGVSKNMIWIHNSLQKVRKCINKEKLEEYINSGWKRGKKYKND